MNIEYSNCQNCSNVIVRSDAIRVWSHLSGMFAGSTRCASGEGKATPTK